MTEILAAVVGVMLGFGLSLLLCAWLGQWLRRPTLAELALFNRAIDHLDEMERQRQSHERELCQSVMQTISGRPTEWGEPVEDPPSWPENITPFPTNSRSSDGSGSATG